MLAEPLPVIEWVHNGRALANNETYRIYVMSKDTNLQVILQVFILTEMYEVVLGAYGVFHFFS